MDQQKDLATQVFDKIDAMPKEDSELFYRFLAQTANVINGLKAQVAETEALLALST